MSNPVHPDLRRVAPLLPRGPVNRRSLPVLRALQRAVTRVREARRLRRGRPEIEVVDLGPISMRVHRPDPTVLAGSRPDAPGRGPASPSPALLWIHGGGFVIGSADQDDAFCRSVANRLGLVVAAVDYRLAPEHPFPVPLHDCHDALVALAGRDEVDSARVVIGGASAGGGLTAGLAALARDRGEVAPILQLLSYPMLDDRTALRTDVDEAHFRLWNNAANRFGWASYLGAAPGSPEVSGLAVPARLDELDGLAPAWLGVGTLDLFHDEDLAYAARLRNAGVPCDVTVVDGAFHGFDSVVPKVAVARGYRDAMVAAIAAALSTG